MKKILTAFLSLSLLIPTLALAESPAATSTQTQSQVAPDGRPVLEVVFVLDTTGSMGGLIEGAKQKIWSIASRMAAGKPTPRIRVGLVAYRDRGDDYVTKVFDLSEDLDSVYTHLMGFSAAGGGDGPEAIGQGISDAVARMSWSQNPRAAKMMFVVGDAPSHDYGDGFDTKAATKKAISKGIVVNTVRCGADPTTESEFKLLASLADGHYDSIAQSGGMVAVATPFDDDLARLNRELVGTSLVGGTRVARSESAGKLAARASMGGGAAADRVEFKARAAPAAAPVSVATGIDLAEAPEKLEALKEDELPDALKGLKPAEREAAVKKSAAERQKIEGQLAEVAKKRADWLSKNTTKKADSFDERVFASVKEKAAKVGVAY